MKMLTEQQFPANQLHEHGSSEKKSLRPMKAGPSCERSPHRTGAEIGASAI
jgi:hypothetical protein